MLILYVPFRIGGSVGQSVTMSLGKVSHERRGLFRGSSGHFGPVAAWCRSFVSAICRKGNEPWTQSGRVNFARMRCGLR